MICLPSSPISDRPHSVPSPRRTPTLLASISLSTRPAMSSKTGGFSVEHRC